jgi:two-component system, NtrC family, nitrogen regulation sensor histidine kinase NtrY
MFNKNQLYTVRDIVLLFLLVSGAIFFTYLTCYLLLLLVSCVFVLFMWYLIKKQNYVLNELEGLVETMKQGDFTRYYTIKISDKNKQALHEQFNAIQEVVRAVRQEREAQHIYLNSILELVDTGILSFEQQSGEVHWMNKALKNFLQLPYLRYISTLAKRDENLYQAITTLAPGKVVVYTFQKGQKILRLQLSAVLFNQGDKQFKLIAFQNISKALYQEETEAWQRLLRVMTHEIMNSVAPIHSIASTLKQKFTSDSNSENTKDIAMGVSTIEERSHSLLRFAESYRHLNKTQHIHKTTFSVWEMFEHVSQLFHLTFEQHNIELEIILENPNLQLEADKVLVEQMVINLVLNAIDALKDIESKRIKLSGRSEAALTLVSVSDNGIGISKEIKDKIFIPFYSSKAKGSGIGLSLCRQIMHLHEGEITLISSLNEGSTFQLVF